MRQLCKGELCARQGCRWMVSRDKGFGCESKGGVVTPFLTQTVKLPMRQQISRFWYFVPILVSFCLTFVVFWPESCYFKKQNKTKKKTDEVFTVQYLATHSPVFVHSLWVNEKKRGNIVLSIQNSSISSNRKQKKSKRASGGNEGTWKEAANTGWRWQQAAVFSSAGTQ